MVSTRPLISNSSGPCTSLLVIVPSAPTTTGITVTLMFHSFFNSLARSRAHLSFRFLSALFCCQPEQQSQPLGRCIIIIIIENFLF